MSNYNGKDNGMSKDNEKEVQSIVISNQDEKGNEYNHQIVTMNNTNTVVNPFSGNIKSSELTFSNNENRLFFNNNGMTNQLQPVYNQIFPITLNSNGIKKFEKTERPVQNTFNQNLSPINSNFSTLNNQNEFYKNNKLNIVFPSIDTMSVDIVGNSKFVEMKEEKRMELSNSELNALKTKTNFSIFEVSKEQKEIESLLIQKTFSDINSFINSSLYKFLQDKTNVFINSELHDNPNYEILKSIINILNGETTVSKRYVEYIVDLLNIYNKVFIPLLRNRQFTKDDELKVINNMIRLTKEYFTYITQKKSRDSNITALNTVLDVTKRFIIGLSEMDLVSIKNNLNAINRFVNSGFNQQSDINSEIKKHLISLSSILSQVSNQSNLNVENIDILKNTFLQFQSAYNKQIDELKNLRNELNRNIENIQNSYSALESGFNNSNLSISEIENYLRGISGDIGDEILNKVLTIIRNFYPNQQSINQQSFNPQIIKPMMNEIRNQVLNSIKEGLFKTYQMVENVEKRIQSLNEIEKRVKELEDTFNGIGGNNAISKFNEMGIKMNDFGTRMNEFETKMNDIDNMYKELNGEIVKVRDGLSQSISSSGLFKEMNERIIKMEEDFSKKLEQTNKKIEELEEKNTILENEIKGIKTEKRMRRDLKLRVSKNQKRYNEEIRPIFNKLNEKEVNTTTDLLSYILDFCKELEIVVKEQDIYYTLRFIYDFLDELSSIVSMSNGQEKMKTEFLNRINRALRDAYEYLTLARSISNDRGQIAKLYRDDFESLKRLLSDLINYLK